MLKLAAAKLLTVKAATIAATAVTIAGGAALAATGNMPNPVAGLGSAPAADAAPTELPTPAAAADRGEAEPSPSLEGLCEAFLAGATDNEGMAVESPAFQALVAAAGSEEGVEDYCADLVPDAERGNPGARPTSLPTPTELPTPTDLPTVAPTDHPGPGERPDQD